MKTIEKKDRIMKGRLLKDVVVPGINRDEWDRLSEGTKVEIVRDWCDCSGCVCQCVLENGRQVVINLDDVKITDHRPYVDWGQRRYELVKEIFPFCVSKKYNGSTSDMARLTIDLADELIKQLKGE